ncbi:hypothetical protein APV28_2813 [Comamonas testosteroni]|nr:hypothetical protein APV28_2813 [Comamonas testosteroni]
MRCSQVPGQSALIGQRTYKPYCPTPNQPLCEAAQKLKTRMNDLCGFCHLSIVLLFAHRPAKKSITDMKKGAEAPFCRMPEKA